MKIKLRYFGQLQEATGKKEEVLTEAFENLGNLRIFLVKQYPQLNNVNFKILLRYYHILRVTSRIFAAWNVAF